VRAASLSQADGFAPAERRSGLRGPVRPSLSYWADAFGRLRKNRQALLSLIIVISTIASLVPIPGGPTAVTSVGMSGALAAAGVPTEAAVAAALVNQVVVSYLPALPGWFATKDLLRAQYL